MGPGVAWGEGLSTSAQVNVSFSLSLELLSDRRLPADQMLPGVDVQQSASGETEMVFSQNLLLEYANRTTQVSPRPAAHAEGGGTLFWTNPDRALRIRGAPAFALRAQSAMGEALHMER